MNLLTSPFASACFSLFAGALTLLGIWRGVKHITLAQDRASAALNDMTRWIATLAGAASANNEQHAELSKRLLALELTVGAQTESIRVLRARSHDLANKMMIIDPNWRARDFT